MEPCARPSWYPRIRPLSSVTATVHRFVQKRRRAAKLLGLPVVSQVRRRDLPPARGSAGASKIRASAVAFPIPVAGGLGSPLTADLPPAGFAGWLRPVRPFGPGIPGASLPGGILQQAFVCSGWLRHVVGSPWRLTRAATCAAHKFQYAGRWRPLQAPVAASRGAESRSRKARREVSVWGLSALRGNAVPQDPTNSICLPLGPSRQLTFMLGALHLGAVACGFVTDLPLAIQGLLALCVLLAAVRGIALHGSRRAARSIVLLVWDRRGQWRLLQRDGQMLDVRLEHGAYAHPKLLVLPFRTHSGRRVSVLVALDMADAEGLRRLRMRLRCGLSSNP